LEGRNIRTAMERRRADLRRELHQEEGWAFGLLQDVDRDATERARGRVKFLQDEIARLDDEAIGREMVKKALEIATFVGRLGWGTPLRENAVLRVRAAPPHMIRRRVGTGYVGYREAGELEIFEMTTSPDGRRWVPIEVDEVPDDPEIWSAIAEGTVKLIRT
jgi:hypothetical protein